MPGFVDVTNMSDLEVKRLGRCDDPVEAQPPRRRYVKPAPVMVDGLIAFTAAAVAHRINEGEYVKAGSGLIIDDEWTPNPKTPNRKIMDSVISGEIVATVEDWALAEKIRTHYKGLTFKILVGKILSPFDQKSMALAAAEKVSEYDLNIIASLPAGYSRAEKRQTIEERLSNCERGHLGVIGQKITITGEVVRCSYSQQWGTYYITVITADNHAVFFGNKLDAKVGEQVKIAGTVKAHRDGFQTQLNYTKYI